MAGESRCCIHHPLEPIQSTLWTVSQQSVTIVNPADNEAFDHRPCCVKWQQFQRALYPPQLIKAAADHSASSMMKMLRTRVLCIACRENTLSVQDVTSVSISFASMIAESCYFLWSIKTLCAVTWQFDLWVRCIYYASIFAFDIFWTAFMDFSIFPRISSCSAVHWCAWRCFDNAQWRSTTLSHPGPITATEPSGRRLIPDRCSAR